MPRWSLQIIIQGSARIAITLQIGHPSYSATPDYRIVYRVTQRMLLPITMPDNVRIVMMLAVHGQMRTSITVVSLIASLAMPGMHLRITMQGSVPVAMILGVHGQMRTSTTVVSRIASHAMPGMLP